MVQRARDSARGAASVAIGVLVLTVLNVSPSPAATNSGFSGRVGLSNHLIWESSSTIVAEFERMKAAGVTWDREDFLWSAFEPSRGSFDWSRADTFVRLAESYGIDVMPIIGYDTSWSSIARGTFDVNAYANFAAKIVKRYPSIKAVELWNEPFMSFAWGGTRPDPAKYATLVRAAATAIRSARTGVKIGAEVDLHNYADGSPYFAQLLDADPTVHRLLDFWAVHPYSGNCSPLAGDATCPDLGQDWRFDRVPKISQYAASRGASLPIWITEWGYTTATSWVSEATQATYLVDGIRRALTEFGVERVFAYTGDKDGTDPNDREAHYGLRHADGSEKPAWPAIRALMGGSAAPADQPPAAVQPSLAPPTTVQIPPRPTPIAPSPFSAAAPKSPRTSSRPVSRGKQLKPSGTATTGSGPDAVPQWFWPWARWRLGRGEFRKYGPVVEKRRPDTSPLSIPSWAWRRLAVVAPPGARAR